MGFFEDEDNMKIAAFNWFYFILMVVAPLIFMSIFFVVEIFFQKTSAEKFINLKKFKIAEWPFRLRLMFFLTIGMLVVGVIFYPVIVVVLAMKYHFFW